MFNFFSAIAGFVTSIVDFVVNLFTMLLSMVSMIGKGAAFLFNVVTHLPPFIIPFCMAFVGFAIFFQIMNKGS